MFAWAFKQLGGYMYHGSNTMWSKYTTNKGTLEGGKRTDGKQLKPGTAVFKVRDTDYYHVGLYVGGGMVIEASGTRSGVVQSAVSKWHTWGELEGVDYDYVEPAVPATSTDLPAATAKPATETKKTTGGVVPMDDTNAVVIVDGGVNMRASTSTKAVRLITIPKGSKIKAETYDDTWSAVEYNGKKGYVVTKYISYEVDAANETIFNEQMQIIKNMEKELARLKTLLGT